MRHTVNTDIDSLMGVSITDLIGLRLQFFGKLFLTFVIGHFGGYLCQNLAHVSGGIVKIPTSFISGVFCGAAGSFCFKVVGLYKRNTAGFLI